MSLISNSTRRAGLFPVKVFGERNFGTTWVERTIARNLPGARLIHHRGARKGVIDEIRRDQQRLNAELREERWRDGGGKSRKGDRPDATDEETTAQPKRLMQVALREAAFDRLFLGPDGPPLGWKHAVLDFDRHGDNAMGVVVVCVVRNPFQFLQSLHRRPYHALCHIPERFDDFVRVPWPTVRRDGIVAGVLERGAAELWNHKVRSYVAAKARRTDIVIVRYEDCLADPFALVRLVADAAGVPPPATTWEITKNTKGGEKTLEDYRRDAEAYDPADRMEPVTLAYLLEVLDGDLLDRFGYRPASAPSVAAQA